MFADAGQYWHTSRAEMQERGIIDIETRSSQWVWGLGLLVTIMTPVILKGFSEDELTHGNPP